MEFHFPDGTIKYGIENVTCSTMQPFIVDSPEQAWEKWHNGDYDQWTCSDPAYHNHQNVRVEQPSRDHDTPWLSFHGMVCLDCNIYLGPFDLVDNFPNIIRHWQEWPEMVEKERLFKELMKIKHK